MPKTNILFLFFFPVSIIAQVPELVFQSGFEPNTAVIMQSSTGADIIGVDNSVPPPNDWVNDLEGHPNFFDFRIQYEDGDSTQRKAEIAPDPTNSANNTLRYWIYDDHIESGIGIKKGRVQSNLYFNSNLYNVMYSVRMLLPSDFNLVKSFPYTVGWLTIAEFWNEPNWTGSPYPFRITLSIKKPSDGLDSVYFSAHAQTYDSIGPSNYVWTEIWESTNLTFPIPVGKWMTLDINFIEGDASTGRFVLKVTPDGGSPVIVIDVTNYTYHPSNPSPDGLSHFNPMKLYTFEALIDSVRNGGGLLQIYWDDFVLWKDSSLVTGIRGNPLNAGYKVYPNPTNQYVTLEFDYTGQGNHTLTLYNTQGQLVSRITNITLNKTIISTASLTTGLYFFQLNTDEHIWLTGKLIIK